MSRDGSIELDWAGGRHLFRLRIKELEKLDEACDVGPAFMLQRLNSGAWKIKDIRETLLWGLVGGGLPVTEAQKLLSTYLVAPFMQHVLPAQAVIMACLVGSPQEDALESDGEKERPKAEAAKDYQEEK